MNQQFSLSIKCIYLLFGFVLGSMGSMMILFPFRAFLRPLPGGQLLVFVPLIAGVALAIRVFKAGQRGLRLWPALRTALFGHPKRNQ